MRPELVGLRRRQLGDEAPVLDDRVVARHEHAVGRHARVDLDPAQPARDRRPERRERVLALAADDSAAAPAVAAEHRGVGEDAPVGRIGAMTPAGIFE